MEIYPNCGPKEYPTKLRLKLTEVKRSAEIKVRFVFPCDSGLTLRTNMYESNAKFIDMEHIEVYGPSGYLELFSKSNTLNQTSQNNDYIIDNMVNRTINFMTSFISTTTENNTNKKKTNHNNNKTNNNTATDIIKTERSVVNRNDNNNNNNNKMIQVLVAYDGQHYNFVGNLLNFFYFYSPPIVCSLILAKSVRLVFL